MKKTELKDLYSVMFPNYPDVVNAEQLSEMLGGVSTKTVYRLLKKGETKSAGAITAPVLSRSHYEHQ